MHRVLFALAAAGGVYFVLLPTSGAQTVWSGYDFAFTKENNADETDSDNWDIITSNVAIIRAATEGIYNPFEEGFYGSESPADTEWATDYNNPDDEISATNYAALDFVPWLNAYVEGLNTGQLPTSLIGRNAVVRLVTDNIYLDLRFEAWTPSNGGGGFSYLRALPPPDYNVDGFVDAADYVQWRKTNGNQAPLGTGADGYPDEIVNEDDYNLWFKHFGTTVPGGAGMAIAAPEPSALTFIMLIVLAGNVRIRLNLVGMR